MKNLPVKLPTHWNRILILLRIGPDNSTPKSHSNVRNFFFKNKNKNNGYFIKNLLVRLLNFVPNRHGTY